VGVPATTLFLGDQALYDSICYAEAVVALNTSAQIEAGLLGKPVLTVLAPEYAQGQQGSLHFDYLLEEKGGHVQVAADLDQHIEQLEAVLGGAFDAERCRKSIERFVRPAGLERPASPILADAIEQWMTTEARPRPGRLSRVRKKLANLLAGPDVVDDEAVATVVRARLRFQRQRTKEWKRQVHQLTSELEQLRANTSGKRAPSVLTPERAPEGEEPRVVKVDYSGATIRIFTTSRAERRWRARACAKEPWTVAWLDDHVQPGDVVFDLGANVGVFSFIAATRLAGRGTVVAFEPSYANYARLCENIVLNDFEATVVPIPLPLSNANGLQAFSYRSPGPGQSRHDFSGTPWRAGEATSKHYTQPMLAMALDDLVQQFGLPSPTHIKIDVDGAERQVLEGATRTLSDASVRSLMIEIDAGSGDDINRRLESLGWRLRSKYQNTAGKVHAPWYGLFERASRATLPPGV
jgi:FkbM family methyltransferase